MSQLEIEFPPLARSLGAVESEALAVIQLKL